MKILAIMGSPRKGDSYAAVYRLEKKMQSLGQVDFEYLWLKDADLKLCRGCGVCFEKGEEFCPHKDSREKIAQAMHNADGVIFASPVYVVNVTALMKNFIDRLAYICHRPRFFDKYALLLTTSAGFGSAQTLQALDWAARTWGFMIVNKVGLVGFSFLSAVIKKRTENIIDRAAREFYRVVEQKKVIPPNLFSLICFKAQKAAFAKANKESFDFKYWEAKGWLKKDVGYYFPIRINIIKRMIAAGIFKLFQLIKEGAF